MKQTQYARVIVYDPGVWNDIDTGDTPAAIRSCKEVTNGIEYMKIYAPDNMLEELFNYTKQKCLKSGSDTLYTKEQRILTK